MILRLLLKILRIPFNPFHPLVYIGGKPIVGKNVYVGLFSEINAKGGYIYIGDGCDIASFVSINVADSHKKCIGLSDEIERGFIYLEENVFVGSHSFIGGRVWIGHHSVVSAGTILIGKNLIIPPYSLIVGNPAVVKEYYYKDACLKADLENRKMAIQEIVKKYKIPKSYLQSSDNEFVKSREFNLDEVKGFVKRMEEKISGKQEGD